MRKMLLGLSLSLAAFGFFLSPAMAMADPQQALSAADQAFLSSLAAPVKAPVAPEPAARRPAGLEKALCNATANCWDGTTRSCQGNNSTTSCTAVDSNCSVNQRGYVTCDGATQWCPTCPDQCPAGWCDFEWECAQSCYPCNYTYTCNQTYCTDICRCNFRTCPV